MEYSTLGIRRMAVVGESHYQRTIRKARRQQPLWALLVPEDDNRHDSSAVRVDLHIAGRWMPAGHLSRENARKWRPEILRSPVWVMLPAAVFGGTRDKPELGVWIGEEYGASSR